MARKTNPELIQEIADQLTKGFYIVDPQTGEVIGDENTNQQALDATKPWRSALWSLFREAADRLDPVAAHARTKR